MPFCLFLLLLLFYLDWNIKKPKDLLTVLVINRIDSHFYHQTLSVTYLHYSIWRNLLLYMKELFDEQARNEIQLRQYQMLYTIAIHVLVFIHLDTNHIFSRSFLRKAWNSSTSHWHKLELISHFSDSYYYELFSNFSVNAWTEILLDKGSLISYKQLWIQIQCMNLMSYMYMVYFLRS